MTSAIINESKRNVTVGVNGPNIGDSQKYTTYMKLNSSDVIDVTNDAVTVNGTVTATDVRVNDVSLNQQSNALSTLTTNVQTLEQTVESLQKEVDDLKNISRVDISYNYEGAYPNGHPVFTLNYDRDNNELYFFDYPSYKIDGVQYGVISVALDFGNKSQYAILGPISFNPQTGESPGVVYYANTEDGLEPEYSFGMTGSWLNTWGVSYNTSSCKIIIDAGKQNYSGRHICFAESVNIFQRPKSTP